MIFNQEHGRQGGICLQARVQASRKVAMRHIQRLGPGAGLVDSARSCDLAQFMTVRVLSEPSL